MSHSLPTAGRRRRISFSRWPSISGTGVVVCALLRARACFNSRPFRKTRQLQYGPRWLRRRTRSTDSYCENCHMGKIVPGDVTIAAVSEGVRSYALDPKNAEALWKKGEEMVAESF